MIILNYFLIIVFPTRSWVTYQSNLWPSGGFYETVFPEGADANQGDFGLPRELLLFVWVFSKLFFLSVTKKTFGNRWSRNRRELGRGIYPQREMGRRNSCLHWIGNDLNGERNYNHPHPAPPRRCEKIKVWGNEGSRPCPGARKIRLPKWSGALLVVGGGFELRLCPKANPSVST
jgi:hypothetical protein